MEPNWDRVSDNSDVENRRAGDYIFIDSSFGEAPASCHSLVLHGFEHWKALQVDDWNDTNLYTVHSADLIRGKT